MLKYQNTTTSFGWKWFNGWAIDYPQGIIPSRPNLFTASGSKWLQLIVIVFSHVFSVSEYETEVDDNTGEFTYCFCVVVLGFYIHLTEHYIYEGEPYISEE